MMHSEQEQSVRWGKTFPLLEWLVIAVVLLFAANSLINITQSARIYSTALRSAFLSNDWINLFFGVLLLLVSLFSAARQRRLGFALLAAALLFVLYNEIAYLFAVRNPFSLVMNALMVVLCCAALYLMCLLFPALPKSEGAIDRPTWGYSVVLIAIGAVFAARAVMQILQPGSGDASLATVGVALADLVLCAVWVTGGILLLKKSAAGIMMGMLSLLNGSILFLALIAFLLLQPLVVGSVFAAADLAVIAGMSLIFFIPTGLLMKRLYTTETKAE